MKETLGGSKLPCRGQEAPQSALSAVSGQVDDPVKHSSVLTSPSLPVRRHESRSSGVTGLRFERNLDLAVAARLRGGNGSGDAVDMLANTGPLGAASQHDQRHAAHSQVLLVADPPIGRQQQVEACLLGSVQECAVAERIPAFAL